jgi:mono/diheme cytochrome c family protein
VVLGSAVLSVTAQQMPGKGRGEGTERGGQEEHGDHGTPPEWKFTWPQGDSAKGREVFVRLECYSCHEVKGEKFPAPSQEGKVGPELSAMGPLHEPEYFAEAIIHPNAVIEKGKGYSAPDGSSKMPSFNDSATVQEVVDLVAFLRALKPPAAAPAGHGRGH